MGLEGTAPAGLAGTDRSRRERFAAVGAARIPPCISQFSFEGHLMAGGLPLAGRELTEAISQAMVGLYAEFYGHERTTATTYINDNVVVCVLEDILSDSESLRIAEGGSVGVIDGRVAFQTRSEDEFTAAVERITDRRVTAFLSANQTTPGVACELFFLEPLPG
jgi:uncharacterized protein YbcI